MQPIASFLLSTASEVGHSFAANWPFLLASIVIAAVLRTFLDDEAVARFFARHQRSGVFTATAAGVATPLCSCGTTAVLLGMMATATSWGPMVAFMVSSPLTSPQEYVYSAALFGWRFATAFFGASIVLGILGGWIAHALESAGLLRDQARMKVAPKLVAENASLSRGARLTREVVLTGRQLLFFFTAFAFIGYALNGLIPSGTMGTLFGRGHVYGVPLAATLGIPLYFNTEASLPLVRPMLDSGMSGGAALAFLITGAGTSIGAIVGALTIARWRVVAVVVATLWCGAVLLGYGYDLFAGVVV